MDMYVLTKSASGTTDQGLDRQFSCVLPSTTWKDVDSGGWVLLLRLGSRRRGLGWLGDVFLGAKLHIVPKSIVSSDRELGVMLGKSSIGLAYLVFVSSLSVGECVRATGASWIVTCYYYYYGGGGFRAGMVG